MRVILELAEDRPTEEMVAAFVDPLSRTLLEENLGYIRSCRETSEFFLRVDVRVRNAAGFDRILDYLAEADAPTGSLIYQRNWLGRNSNIFVLGP